LDPGSYLTAVEWFKKTMLNSILHVNSECVNKTKIFRELDEIEDRKKINRKIPIPNVKRKR